MPGRVVAGWLSAAPPRSSWSTIEPLDMESLADVEVGDDDRAALDGVVPEAAEEVQAMKAQGLPNKEIAELLELTPSEVTAYLKQGKGNVEEPDGAA